VAKEDPAKLKKVKVSLPFGMGEAEWEEDPTERRAAWSLYVELVTRIAVQPLGMNDGLVREALTSLHQLFGVTREILRAAGPDVGASRDTVGGIAVTVLNRGLRPFLAKWHPLLQAWESQRIPGASPGDHERAWSDETTVRGELEALRGQLEIYSHTLALMAGVEE
jgi:hypothetical protein